MKKSNLLKALVGVLFAFWMSTFEVQADTGAQATHRFRCESSELGIVEISLSKPVQRTIGCSYYEIDLVRYDLNGRLVERRHQEEKDSWTKGNFDARYCRGESYVGVRFPVTNVDWSKHPGKCWVKGQFPGTYLDLDVNSGKVLNISGKTIFTLHELNPTATFDWVSRGGPFRILVPFVNGKECDATSDSVYASASPTCTLIQ